MLIQPSYLDIMEEIKEWVQLSKIKSSYEIFPYTPRETTTQPVEEQESKQFISPWVISWICNKILHFIVEEQKISILDIQKEYYFSPIGPFLEYKQEHQKLEQLALYIIVQKFKKIERVKSIYVQRYRRELQIFVLLLVDKYDADLMDKLLDIEYEIRKMFPDIVFQFFYPPAGISEKKDFIHPQAECIYKNLSLPPELENTDIIKIEEMYEFSDKERVRNFILQNKDLIRILKEAPEHIYKIFGKNIKLYLELHSDPEENWDELFIIIKSPHSAEKAHELGRQLFREWFVKIIKRVGNRLNFSEEPL